MTIDAPVRETESASLADFGYSQQLHRSLGSYASFAAGFSFISVLTTVFQLMSLGYSFGGPAFFWSWPLVLIGQLFVALCFAELAARYPISGAIYQWSTRLANRAWGWFAGWTMLVGQIAVVTAAALALQVVLPGIWSGFQLVGGDPTITTPSGALNAVVLGAVLIALTTIVNVIGVRFMSAVNAVGVTCELVGAAVLIVLLLTHAKRGPGVLFDTAGIPAHGNYLWPFVVSSFTAAYVMIGFDSAGELSEETRHARRVAPRTIVRALSAAGVLGGGLIVAVLMAAPSLTDGNLVNAGPAYVVLALFSGLPGKVLLIDVAIAICVATLAVQTAASRMMFSMARDSALPLSRMLRIVPRRTGTPIVSAIVVGVAAAGLLLLNLASQQALADVETTCVVLIYLAYLMVTGPQLIKRLRHRHRPEPAGVDELGEPLFSLGRWGIPVNVAAVGYGALMLVNLAWPRASIYDPAGGGWALQYFPLLFLAGTFALGGVTYLRVNRRTAPATALEAAPQAA